MLNGYSQWLNIRGFFFYREISITYWRPVIKIDAIKQILKICCLYINLKIECEIIAI